jgi:hypothetical protein
MKKEKLNQIARQFTTTDGQEIAEVALVLPVVFMLLLGIVWFGRAFNIYSTITQAAQQGAITAARPVCATCSTTGGWNGTEFPNDTTVGNTINAVMQASSIDPTKIPANSNPPTPTFCPSPPNPPGACSGTNITICREVLLNYTIGTPPPPSQCGVIVSFQYPFQFYLPFTSLNLKQITLSAQAQSRMEN